MTNFIDGPFDAELISSFLTDCSDGKITITHLHETPYTQSFLELLSSKSDSNIEVKPLAFLAKSNNHKAPFDLILLGDDFFITLKNSTVHANKGKNEALSELRSINVKLESLCSQKAATRK